MESKQIWQRATVARIAQIKAETYRATTNVPKETGHLIMPKVVQTEEAVRMSLTDGVPIVYDVPTEEY